MDVIYTPEIFSYQSVGGISRYFHELIVRMQQTGPPPTVLAGLHRNQYLRGMSGVRGWYVPKVGPWRNPLNRLFGAGIIATRHRAVIHQTYYAAATYPSRHRVVVTVYDMIHELLPDQLGIPSPLVEAAACEKRNACRQADAIIAISQRTKDDLVAVLGLEPAKITVVPLGVSLAAPPAGSPPPVAGAGTHLLYVGNRSFYKNFAALLAAYAASPALQRRCRLLCFGGGPFSERELRAIAAAGLTEKVSWRGGDDRALAESYRCAAAFVFPSLYEGFGLPLLEAMTQDCPVVCARAGSLPEVAGDAAEYFDPASSEDLRQTLETTLADPTRLALLRARGRARVRLFSWDQCYRETSAVYRRLAASQ